MFDPVPVLPVVVPLGVAVLAGLLWSLHRRGRLSWPRIVVAVSLAVYVAGVVAHTVFPIFRGSPQARARGPTTSRSCRSSTTRSPTPS
ncbi:hypothetical protein [Cellulomonas soli]